MASRPWLDDVQKRLAGHGLPPSYVQRLVQELSDHFDDLTEETMNTEPDAYSRLGEPEQVARAAVAAYRRRSFLGRHPAAAVVVFGVSPVVSLAALVAVVLVVVLGFVDRCEQLGIIDHIHCIDGFSRFEPVASVAVPYMMSLLIVAIPCILASTFYCRLARRLGIGKKWMLLACAMLAVLAAIPYCSAKLSVIPGESALRLGALNLLNREQLFYLPVWVLRSPRQLVQFAVPLAVGWWFMRRRRDRDPLPVVS